MCIIIYIPEAHLSCPTKEILSHCWDQNPHNGGFMYNTPAHNMKFFRTDNKEQFIETFIRRWNQFGATSPFVLHMRYATDGTKSLENTHPFKVNRRYGFVHNGRIINCIPEKKFEHMSDTAVFNHVIMKRLPNGWFGSDFTMDLLDEYIGKTSKLVIMDRWNKIQILGEKLGEWVDGIWYSNDYYKTERAKATTYTTWAGWKDDEEDWKEAWKQELDKPKISSSTPAAPQWYLETKGNSPFCCNLCGKGLTCKDIYNMIVKLPGGKRVHRIDLCSECWSGYLVRHRIPVVTTCVTCKKELIHNSAYRPDYICIDLSIPQIVDVEVNCSKCTFDTWRNQSPQFTTGWAGWIVDPMTFEYNSYSSMVLDMNPKQIIETVEGECYEM